MKRDETLRFIITESIVHFDNGINRQFIIERDFNKERFKQFFKMSNISLPQANYKTILKNLGVGIYEKGMFYINNAGVLTFAKDVSKFFRHNFVTCVLYKGKDKSKVLDRKDFTDDLMSNYYDTITFLKSHLYLGIYNKRGRTSPGDF